MTNNIVKSVPHKDIITILSSISNNKSLELFNTVALLDQNSRGLRVKLKFTKKQYYSRIHNLTTCGLIKRHGGKYYLTSLGKVVYDIEAEIGNAINNFWQLKALDSARESDDMELNDRESYSKLVDSLIYDTKSKNFSLQFILIPKFHEKCEVVTQTLPLS